MTLWYDDDYLYDERFPGFPGVQGAPYLDAQATFMTDTNVNDRASRVITGENDFSVDALGAMDPRIRAIFAELVTTAEGDPYQAYALANTPEYKQALTNRLVNDIESMVPEGYTVNVRGELVPGHNPERIMVRRTGNTVQDSVAEALARRKYAEKLGADMIEQAFFQSAPSVQRNLQIEDAVHEHFGGMPYPGGGVDFGGGGAPVGGGPQMGRGVSASRQWDGFQTNRDRYAYAQSLYEQAKAAGLDVSPPPKPVARRHVAASPQRETRTEQPQPRRNNNPSLVDRMFDNVGKVPWNWRL